MARESRKPVEREAKKPRQVDHTGQVKRTMWLPGETAKKLRHVAVERGVQIGQVVAPLLDREFAGSYWVVRSSSSIAPKLAVVEVEAAPPSGEGEGSGPGEAA